ncbi:unnamed protein product [Schistosoma turkestanicum]|nr:unnamed protein product [Schistosoma turkestanicum]
MVQPFVLNNKMIKPIDHINNEFRKSNDQSAFVSINKSKSVFNNNSVPNLFRTSYFHWDDSSETQYYSDKIVHEETNEKLDDSLYNEIEQLNDSRISINKTFSDFYSPSSTVLYNLNKQQIDINLDSNTNLRFVKYFVGETIRMRCIVPEGPYVIIWNKIGEEYPLTIGKHRFIPDKRISIKQKSPNKWILRIIKAKLTDSGLYTCTTKSIHKEDMSNQNANVQNNTDQAVNPVNVNVTLTRKQKNNPDYYISVVEPWSVGEKQANLTVVSDNSIFKNRTLTVTGPRAVYYGSPLELKCYAKFSTDIQTSNYEILLEWYHHGIRKLSDPFKSGVYIEQKWLDSKTLESRLFIKWASDSDTGQWICLERYKPSKNITRKTSSHMIHLDPMHKSLLSMDKIRNDRLSISPIKNNRPFPLLTTSHYSVPSSRIMFGRIEVDIIDVSKASINLNVPKSKDSRHLYNYIHPNSKLLQTTVKSIAHIYKTKWSIVNICFSMIILKYIL